MTLDGLGPTCSRDSCIRQAKRDADDEKAAKKNTDFGKSLLKLRARMLGVCAVRTRFCDFFCLVLRLPFFHSETSVSHFLEFSSFFIFHDMHCFRDVLHFDSNFRDSK